MTKQLQRFLSLLLCLCVLGGAVIALAEESPADQSPASDESFNIDEEALLNYERFGAYAQVETDENGKVVSVNGYPTQPVRVGFNNLGQQNSFQMVVDFMEYPFWQSATEYDGNLAMMSLMMAGCANRAIAFQDVPADDFDPSLNLVHFLTDAGFTDIRKDDYSKVPTMFTVSTAMGHRAMTHEGQEPFTLIAVGVCGEGYKNEWESNMTAGTGPIHEGFGSAAQLVIDRLAGYIATRGLTGRIKVWIAGFSRAAAVTNVVAGTLVNTGIFPCEDVYAYTFAAPAAIKNPPAEGYDNIFNIINPADLVPQVMPMEWGYGRYGKDLFLPTQEFASYIGFVENSMRNYTNLTQFDVQYHYSPRLTLRTRLLMSMVLEVTEDTQSYAERFQPAIVGLMHDKTLTNTLSTLRNLMLNIELLDQEDRNNLDNLIDYFLRVFSSLALRSEYMDANQNTGSAFKRLLIEHTPNSYFSAAFSIRNGTFADTDRCCYVMVRGPVSLTLWDETNHLELLTARSDGTVVYSEEFGNMDGFSGLFHAERSRDTTVIAVPMDDDYKVTWTAEKSGTVECVQAFTFVRARRAYPGAMSGKIRVNAGDSGVAFQSKDRESIPLEGYESASFTARSLAEFLGIVSVGVHWRVALSVFAALLTLDFCVFLCLVASRKRTRRGRYSFFVWACLCLLGIAAVETEAAYWFFADMAWVRIVWKAVVALCCLFLYVHLHRKEGSLLHSFFPSVLLAAAADIVISFHFIAGAALFLMCHAVLSYQFQHRSPMSRGRWIQWGAVSATLSSLIILFYALSHGAAGWAVAAYAPVLLLMVFSCRNQPVRIRVSAILFLTSDLLLGLYAALLEDPMIHVVYMFLFYLALLLLTLGPARYADSGLPESSAPAEAV